MKAMAAFIALMTGLFALAISPARAQDQIAVEVGTITSTQSCTTYRNYEGSRLVYSEAEYARYWGAAAARRY